MSARNHVRAGFYQKRINYGRDVHLGRVDRSAGETVDAEKRNKRFKIIQEKGIKKGMGIWLSSKVKGVVKFIKSDGVIMLEDWSIVDPLDF